MVFREKQNYTYLIKYYIVTTYLFNLIKSISFVYEFEIDNPIVNQKLKSFFDSCGSIMDT